ncbi:hypothetical protein SK128_016086 [Halocaridina rubra]|uniref:Uncharacterized protein n=1 Tax=Halocaridina rubra TaxID=373956 RepID=A0AAN9AH89_HALRR
MPAPGLHDNIPFLLPDNIYGPPRRPEPFIPQRPKPRLKGRKRVTLKRQRQRAPYRTDDDYPDTNLKPNLSTESYDHGQIEVINEQNNTSSDATALFGIKASAQAHHIKSDVGDASLNIRYNSPREVLQKFPPRYEQQVNNINKPKDSQEDSIFHGNQTTLSYPDLQEGIIIEQDLSKPIHGEKYPNTEFRHLAFIPEESNNDLNRLKNDSKTNTGSLLSHLNSAVTVEYPVQQTVGSVLATAARSDELFQFEESERDTSATKLEQDPQQSQVSHSPLLDINSELYEGLRLPYYSLLDTHSDPTNDSNSNITQSKISSPSEPHLTDGTVTDNQDFPFILQESLQNTDHSQREINEDQLQLSQNTTLPTGVPLQQNLHGAHQFQQTLLQPQQVADNLQFPDYYDPALFEYLDALYRAQAQGFHVPDYIYDYDYDDYVNAQLARPPPNEELLPPPLTQGGIPLHLPQALNGFPSAFPQRQKLNPADLSQLQNTGPVNHPQVQNGNILPPGITLNIAELLNGRLSNSPTNPIRNNQGLHGFSGVPFIPPQNPFGIPAFPLQRENEFPLSFANRPIGKPSDQSGVPLILSQNVNQFSTSSSSQESDENEDSLFLSQDLIGIQNTTETQFGIPLEATRGQNLQFQQSPFNNHFGVPLPQNKAFPSQITSSSFPTTPRIRFTEESVLNIKPQAISPATASTGLTVVTPPSLRNADPTVISIGHKQVSQVPTTRLPSTHLPTNRVNIPLPPTRSPITLLPAVQIPLGELLNDKKQIHDQKSLTAFNEKHHNSSTASTKHQANAAGKGSPSRSQGISFKTPVSLIEERPIVLVGGVTDRTAVLVEEQQSPSLMTTPNTLTKLGQNISQVVSNNGFPLGSIFTTTEASVIEVTANNTLARENIPDTLTTINVLPKSGTLLSSSQDVQLEKPFSGNENESENGKQNNFSRNISGDINIPVSPRSIDNLLSNAKTNNGNKIINTISDPDLKNFFGIPESISTNTPISQFPKQNQQVAFGSGIVVDDEILQNLQSLANNNAFSNGSILNSPSLSSISIFKNLEDAIRNSSESSYFVYEENGDSSENTTKPSLPMSKANMNPLKQLMALKTSDASDIPIIIRNFIAAQENFRGSGTPKEKNSQHADQGFTSTGNSPNLISSLQAMMTKALQTSTPTSPLPESKSINAGLSEERKTLNTGEIQKHFNKEMKLSNTTEEYNGEFIILLSNKSSVYPKDGEFIVIIPQPTSSPFFQRVFPTSKPDNGLAREGSDLNDFVDDAYEDYSVEASALFSDAKVHSTTRRGVPNTVPPEFAIRALQDDSEGQLRKRKVPNHQDITSEVPPLDFSYEDDSKNWYVPYSGDYGLRLSKEEYDLDSVQINKTGDDLINTNETSSTPFLSQEEKRGNPATDYHERYVPAPQSIPQVNYDAENHNSTNYTYEYNQYQNPYFIATDSRSFQGPEYFYHTQYPQYSYGPPSIPVGYSYLPYPTTVPYGIGWLNGNQFGGVPDTSLVTESTFHGLGDQEGHVTDIPIRNGSPTNKYSSKFIALHENQHETNAPNNRDAYDLSNENIESSSDNFDYDSDIETDNNFGSAPDLNVRESYDKISSSNDLASSITQWKIQNTSDDTDGPNSDPTFTDSDKEIQVLNQIITEENVSLVQINNEKTRHADISPESLQSFGNNFPSDSSGYEKEESVVLPIFDVPGIPLVQTTPFSIASSERSVGSIIPEDVEDILNSFDNDNIVDEIKVELSPGFHKENANAEQTLTANTSTDSIGDEEPILLREAEDIFSDIVGSDDDDDVSAQLEDNANDNFKETDTSNDDVIDLEENLKIPDREDLAILQSVGVPLNTKPTNSQSKAIHSGPTMVDNSSKGENKPSNDGTQTSEAHHKQEFKDEIISDTEVIVSNDMNNILPEVVLKTPVLGSGLVSSLDSEVNVHEIISSVSTSQDERDIQKARNKSSEFLPNESLPRDSRIVTIDLGIVPLNSLANGNSTNTTNDDNSKLSSLKATTEPNNKVVTIPPFDGNTGRNVLGSSSKSKLVIFEDSATSETTTVNNNIAREANSFINSQSIEENFSRENTSLSAETNKSIVNNLHEFPFGDLGIPDNLDLSKVSGLTVDLNLTGIQIYDITPLARANNSNLSNSENKLSATGELVSDMRENLEDSFNTNTQIPEDQILIISDNGNNVQYTGDIDVPKPVTTNNNFLGNFAGFFSESPEVNTGNDLNADRPLQFNPIINGNTIRNVGIEGIKPNTNRPLNIPSIPEVLGPESDIFSSKEPIILLESPVKLDSLETVPLNLKDDITLPPHVVTSSIILRENDYLFSDDTGGRENIDFDYTLPETNVKFQGNTGTTIGKSQLKIPGRVDSNKVNNRLTPGLPDVIVGSTDIVRPEPPLQFAPTPAIGRYTETTTTTVYVPVVQPFSVTPAAQRPKLTTNNTQKQGFRPSVQLDSKLLGFNPSIPQFQNTRAPSSNSQGLKQSNKWIWNSGSRLSLTTRPSRSDIRQGTSLYSDQSNDNPSYMEPERRISTGIGSGTKERWVWDPVNRDGIAADPRANRPERLEEWLEDDYLLSPSVVSYLYKKLDDISNEYVVNDRTTRTAAPSTSKTTAISTTKTSSTATTLPQYYWNPTINDTDEVRFNPRSNLRKPLYKPSEHQRGFLNHVDIKE